MHLLLRLSIFDNVDWHPWSYSVSTFGCCWCFILSKKKPEKEQDVTPRLRCLVWLCIRGIREGGIKLRAQQIFLPLHQKDICLSVPFVLSDVYILEKPDFTGGIYRVASESKPFFPFLRKQTFPFLVNFHYMPIFLCGTMAHIFLSPSSSCNFEVLTVTKHPGRQYPDLGFWSAKLHVCALLLCAIIKKKKPDFFLTCHFWHLNTGGHWSHDAQHLRQRGCSWANSQLWLCKRNKAALILLIGKNVLTGRRKRLIQMGLNQSHTPGTDFQEDTCRTTVLSSHRWLQRSRPAHPCRSTTQQC